MTSPPSAGSPALEDRAFLLLLIAVSLAFAWIIWPLFGAVLWAVILAIVFAPVFRRLLRSLRRRRTPAALRHARGHPGARDPAVDADHGVAGAGGLGRIPADPVGGIRPRPVSPAGIRRPPGWVTHLLDRFGLTNLARVQERLSAGLAKSSQFLAAQALNFGQNTLNFVLSTHPR